MSKHTSGQWIAESPIRGPWQSMWRVVQSHTARVIAQLPKQRDSAANARLIAKAPEMYDLINDLALIGDIRELEDFVARAQGILRELSL